MSEKSNSGFTLIEVLIATAIFAVIGVMVSFMLRHSLMVKDQLRVREDRWSSVNRVLFGWENDCRQVIDRPIRDAAYRKQEAFVGDGQHMIFTVQGVRDLQRVEYFLDKHRLIKRRWPVLDRASTTQPIDIVLLEHVESLMFRYVDAHGQLLAYWPALSGSNLSWTERQAVFPSAVQVKGIIEKVGKVKMTFPIVTRGANAA